MFFKKEICVTCDLERMNRIKNRLSEKGIKHTVSTNSITNPGRHHGVAFSKADASYEYRIYVKRSDYEAAVSVIGE